MSAVEGLRSMGLPRLVYILFNFISFSLFKFLSRLDKILFGLLILSAPAVVGGSISICSLKNALLYSLKKCSYSKYHSLKGHFEQGNFVKVYMRAFLREQM